jgi:hypothetical protein
VEKKSASAVGMEMPISPALVNFNFSSNLFILFLPVACRSYILQTFSRKDRMLSVPFIKWSSMPCLPESAIW